MKRKIQFNLSISILLLAFQLKGQQNDFTSHISISSGFTFAGPVGPMSKHLITEGYDAQNVDSWFFGPTDYPVKTPTGGSLALTYSWNVKTNKRINLQVGFSDLGRVSGYGNTQGSIGFDFKAVYGTVFYSYQRRVWELRIGPSLLLNKVRADRFSIENKDSNDTKISLGLFAGAGLRLWDGRRTYGYLNCDYIYSIPNKFGPYQSNSISSEGELPEKSISFKHANASFKFGIHL